MGLYLGGLMFLVAGARLVLSPRFEPALELERIERERVSFMLGFDTHYQDLLQHPDFDQRDRSSVRIGMVPAGSAASQATALRVNERLCRSFSGYGSSECGTAIALSFLDANLTQRSLGSGYPMPGYDFEVRHPETRRPLAANEVGELWIRGYGVMLRYHGKPQETLDAFDEQGWFKTGDMASMDEAGFLRYIGRYKDMLKVGGENVDPTEVEAFLAGIPGLEQVKLVGVPDERLGDRPVACCTPGHIAVSLADVQAQCKGKIASFKIPRDLVWLPSYPMTSTGKLQRPELRRAVIQALEKSTHHLS
jgi:fatty-acyl-CoA synthase